MQPISLATLSVVSSQEPCPGTPPAPLYSSSYMSFTLRLSTFVHAAAPAWAASCRRPPEILLTPEDPGEMQSCHPRRQVASVMSDSVRPHGLQPTRLLCPWDSPGKNTGVGCHFLLQCMKVESESEVTQSCLTLRDPMDSSLPGSSIHGICQTSLPVLEWGAIGFSHAILQFSLILQIKSVPPFRCIHGFSMYKHLNPCDLLRGLFANTASQY